MRDSRDRRSVPTGTGDGSIAADKTSDVDEIA